MTIQLPIDTQLVPRWRIMRKKTWGSRWEELPTDRRLGSSLIPRGGYFHVEEFWRSCIPEPGQAILRYDFGMIDGQYVGINQTTGAAQDQIELTGQIIRIQCAPDTGNPADTELDWRTVWLGGVEAQRDNFAPGAGYVAGSRRFHCLDLLSFYTKRWDMNRHGVFVSAASSMTTDGKFVLNAYGHPGYNSSDWSGRVIGNRSANTYYDAPEDEQFGIPWGAGSGAEFSDDPSVQSEFKSKLLCHTHPGNSTLTWTDLQAVEHALTVTRPRGAPFFYMKDSGSNNLSVLEVTNDWPIRPGMTVWDFLTQVFRRQRGRGVAFLDWDSDLGHANADSVDLVPYINLCPQNLNDISVVNPSGSGTTTFYGATTNGSTKTVDLVGDHRNIAATFELGDRHQHKYDWVESVGENIQVLATLDFAFGERNSKNSLQERWSTTIETAFATDHASNASKCQDTKYDHVYQLVGLNLGFVGMAGNGESGGGAYDRVDYRCSDTGAIVKPNNAFIESQIGTSPALIKIMDDLPIYKDYDYTTGTPVSFNGTESDLSPSRESIKLYVREGTGRFRDAGDHDSIYNCQVHNTPNGIGFKNIDDLAVGARQFSNVAALATRGGTYHWTDLVATVGLELPHRIRMGTAADGFTEATAKRKLTIFHPGLNLWLASPNAIWRLSGSDSSGFAPSRGACGSTDPSNPGKLRDDRDRLAAMHALACSWYLTERRTATWQLKACGFLTSFVNQPDITDSATTTIEYPTIGQLVTTLSAGGTDYTLNTPITKVHFTNAGNGVTTWITDHCDLDFR